MLLGALIAGTIAGIAAGAIAVVTFGASLWFGLLVWWLAGTAVTLAPLALLAMRGQNAAAPAFAAA